MPGIKKSSLYKTEMCRSFEETGYCRYGSKCQFAHDYAELREVNRHPRYKTEICKTFWEQGNCPYGKRCCFIHSVKESLQTSQYLESPECLDMVWSETDEAAQKFTFNMMDSLAVLPGEQKVSSAGNEVQSNSKASIELHNYAMLPPLTPLSATMSHEFGNSEDFLRLIEKKLSVLDDSNETVILQPITYEQIEFDFSKEFDFNDSYKSLNTKYPKHLVSIGMNENEITETTQLAALPVFSTSLPISCIGSDKKSPSLFNPFLKSPLSNDNFGYVAHPSRYDSQFSEKGLSIDTFREEAFSLPLNSFHYHPSPMPNLNCCSNSVGSFVDFMSDIDERHDPISLPGELQLESCIFNRTADSSLLALEHTSDLHSFNYLSGKDIANVCRSKGECRNCQLEIANLTNNWNEEKGLLPNSIVQNCLL